MDGITYAVKEAKEDAFATVIEKRGGVVEFTPVDMLNEQHQLTKLVKELTAKEEMEKAKQANLLNNHPWLADLDLQKLFTAHMYYESLSFIEGLPPKIEEFTKQLADSKTEFAVIAEALSLDILPKKPEVLVDESMAKIVGEEPNDGTEKVS